MNLPIDLIPNTTPPRFRWRQVIDTPIGKKTIEHEGLLPPSVESAVAALVGITKQQVIEIENQSKQLDVLEAALAQHGRERENAPLQAGPVISIKKVKGV